MSQQESPGGAGDRKEGEDSQEPLKVSQNSSQGLQERPRAILVYFDREVELTFDYSDYLRVPFLMLVFLALVWALRYSGIPGTLADQKGVRRDIVVYGHTFPASIVVLVDRSGSMREVGENGTLRSDRYSLAVHEARWVAEQATDEGRVRFFTFAETLDSDPQGWISMPDVPRLKSALCWLSDHEPAGTTDLAGAVGAVLTALPDSPLGVVVLTDGEPDTGPESTVARIGVANSLRKEPAVIGVVVLDPRTEGHGEEFGREMAEVGGGAYVRTKGRGR